MKGDAKETCSKTPQCGSMLRQQFKKVYELMKKKFYILATALLYACGEYATVDYPAPPPNDVKEAGVEESRVANVSPETDASANTVDADVTPVTDATTDADANTMVDTGTDADATVDAGCVPKTCNGEGFTCGQLTTGCGKVETCGACAGGTYCSAPVGNCSTYDELCTNNGVQYLGSCIERLNPTVNDADCSVSFTGTRVTEYHDNVTVAPALAYRNECLLKDAVVPFACSGGRTNIFSVKTWTDLPADHTGSPGGCKRGEYKNFSCYHTVTYYPETVSQADAQVDCANKGGTFVNP